ncbi:MAG: hypothetical protein GY827_00020 [Cytophagales bacterium]|nr:hypothetical protein [Cytophagales bacterium]
MWFRSNRKDNRQIKAYHIGLNLTNQALEIIEKFRKLGKFKSTEEAISNLITNQEDLLSRLSNLEAENRVLKAELEASNQVNTKMRSLLEDVKNTMVRRSVVES